MALEPIRTFFLCATVPTLIGQPQALFFFSFSENSISQRYTNVSDLCLAPRRRAAPAVQEKGAGKRSSRASQPHPTPPVLLAPEISGALHGTTTLQLARGVGSSPS